MLPAQDIFLCVMYTKDPDSIRKLLRCFISELKTEFECAELELLNERLPLVGLRALFLMLVCMDNKLRFWAMNYETKKISKPPPAKLCLFLKTMRDDHIPNWMSDERKTVTTFVRKATELYIKC
jgi:hypothetical protein